MALPVTYRTTFKKMTAHSESDDYAADDNDKEDDDFFFSWSSDAHFVTHSPVYVSLIQIITFTFDIPTGNNYQLKSDNNCNLGSLEFGRFSNAAIYETASWKHRRLVSHKVLARRLIIHTVL